MPRFSLKTLLSAVAIIATVLGGWSYLFRKTAFVRPPRADDAVGQARLFIPRDEDDELRNVAFLSGRFTHWTRLRTSLFAVKAGRIEVQNESTLSRNRWDQASFPSTFEAMLVLRSHQRPDGKVTYLGHRGLLMAGNSVQSNPHDIVPTFTYAPSISFTAGRPYIVYVEGDTTIDATCDMTLDEFAKKNRGNYFVITAEIK